jgi:AraC-like DNA-binding protein
MGVLISLDQRAMTELSIEIENSVGFLPAARNVAPARGVKLARWDTAFSSALLRLVELTTHPTDAAILGDGRLREFYYAVFQGDAGVFARQAFGTQNAITRAIVHLSANLDGQTSIDDMASRAGMSRAVFHRKFKQATAMSPIQFVKSLRLNNAAMKIAGGMTVNEAAMDVGYVSPSQFSREFKRAYGQSPREWRDAQHTPTGLL